MGEYMKRSEYISRDAAISKIRDQGVLGGDYDAYEREEDVVDMLNSIPAADVVEVRHGRWHRFLKGSNSSYGILSEAFQCIICKESFWNKSNYCPSCGAKMDGGQDDE